MKRSLEETIGTRWIPYAGCVALFLAAAFFVQVAIVRGWLGPQARIALALGFGGTLVAVGDLLLRRRLRPLGQGLVGTGGAVLHAGLYAGMASYHLYSPHAAFVGFACVTVLAMGLALRHDSLPVALLALVGGLATPLMVSTGGAERDMLCTYLAILDLGVLAIAFARRWPLDLVAAAGTWLLVGGFFLGHPVTAAPELGWVALFFAIFAVTPFAYHLRRKIPLDAGRFVVAMVNGQIAFGLGAHALELHRDPVAIVALVLGAAYLGLGALARVRIPADERAPAGFLGLALFFATGAIGLLLRGGNISVAWALAAPVVLWLGVRYRVPTIRIGALVIAGLAALHLAAWDLPAHLPLALSLIVPGAIALCAGLEKRQEIAFAALGLAAVCIGEAYGVHVAQPAFVNTRFLLALLPAVAALAFGRRGAVAVLGLVGVWAVLTTEIATHVAQVQMALSVAWSAYAAVLVGLGFRLRARALRVAGLGLFAVTIGKVLVVDLAHVEQLYRVGSFLALGLLLVAAGGLYATSARRA
jgi:uncharacterized membrane protein